MYSDRHLYFDDVEIGREWESPPRTVTSADIADFARLSGDFNPIHVDEEFAQTTPFRRPIAHGLLTLGIGSGLGTNYPPMRTIAVLHIRDWQFKDPVFPGDAIRVRSKVLHKEFRGRGKRGEITWHRTVLNQDDRVVQEGITVTLVECRRPPRGDSDIS